MINEQVTRFSVGAVNVLSGNFIYFDNAREQIEPEHVMASGALPPALPMVKIGTDHFWDSGIVSNTPLQHLLDQDDRLNTLVFQVDLFSARGVLPRDIQDVMARHKDIMYSSRTRYTTDVYRRIHTWKKRLAKALAKIPEDRLSDDERRMRDELPTCRRSRSSTSSTSRRPTRVTPRTTSSPAPRCASTGRAATRIRGGYSSGRNG